MDNETFKTIVVGMYVILLIILVGAVIVASVNKSLIDYSTSLCNESNGTIVYYPQQNEIEFFESTNKTGYWCKLSNGTEIDVNVKEILNNAVSSSINKS